MIIPMNDSMAQTLSMITELRHELHRHPEVSLEEKWTKRHLMEFVREHTTLEITDCGKWFYARKRARTDTQTGSRVPQAGSPEKAIAFRTDFDALPIPETIALTYASENPGVSHKCGHDGHSAVLAGLALELEKRDVSRDVFLVFQHAEEIGAGAKECAEIIEREHIGEIYAFHNLNGYPENMVVFRRGLTQPASEGLTILFHGKTSHASYPEEGANPSFSMADLIAFVRRLLEQPHRGMVLCTVVHVLAGARDFGVSAGEGKISLTLRAEYEEEMREMETAIRCKAEELAQRDHLRVDFRISDYFPETRNSDRCLNRVIRAAGECGIVAMEMPKLWRASEDFGWYLKKCPGAIFYIGDGENYPALHTVKYDFNDRIMRSALRIFLSLACNNDTTWL